MKLCTYDPGNGPRAGVIAAERVLDVATLLGEQGGLRDVRALLELPNDPLTRLKSSLSSANTAQGVPLASVRLRAPILQPPTVRDFMVYEDTPIPGANFVERILIPERSVGVNHASLSRPFCHARIMRPIERAKGGGTKLLLASTALKQNEIRTNCGDVARRRECRVGAT